MSVAEASRQLGMSKRRSTAERRSMPACSRTSVHKAELNALYQRRWSIELDFGCLKTTLGMAVLRCRTPAMIEKELWTYLLACNLIRLLMCTSYDLI